MNIPYIVTVLCLFTSNATKHFKAACYYGNFCVSVEVFIFSAGLPLRIEKLSVVKLI